MAITAHIYQIFIAAPPEAVWAAITESDWTRRYFHGTSFVEGPTLGARYLTRTADGGEAVDGVIEEMEPPADGRPGRFVQTWHVLYDAAMADEPPSRVEWTVEAAGDGLTRVRLVHGDLAGSPLTWSSVRNGWVWVLDALKTVLETGKSLPRPSPPAADEEATAAERPDADWHRRQGIQANNSAFELLERERSSGDDEDLLRTAYAAAYHWQRAADAGPENETRASYLVAKALLATGQGEAALHAADRSLRTCTENGLTDFDLAYAHEVRARALRALGQADEAEREWRRALAVPIADPEDAEIVRADLAVEPVEPGTGRPGTGRPGAGSAAPAAAQVPRIVGG
jgi:uncharacterized protein YndB with AHSA1/START domain